MASATFGSLFSAREAVLRLTPARAATWVSVGRRSAGASTVPSGGTGLLTCCSELFGGGARAGESGAGRNYDIDVDLRNRSAAVCPAGVSEPDR
nr:hypothetical protein GCM10020092_023120 [Actinoplanes digitatis]